MLPCGSKRFTETARLIRDWEKGGRRYGGWGRGRLYTRRYTVQCCFTSTETVRTITVLGTGKTHDVHLFHTALELKTERFRQCCFTSTETVRTVTVLGTGKTHDVHLFHTALELKTERFSQCCFTSTETARTIRDRTDMPRTFTSTFTQLLNSER